VSCFSTPQLINSPTVRRFSSVKKHPLMRLDSQRLRVTSHSTGWALAAIEHPEIHPSIEHTLYVEVCDNKLIDKGNKGSFSRSSMFSRRFAGGAIGVLFLV
jgi:hypothetical protein